MTINLKQLETTEFVIGEYTFYVKPFPAMKCANISTDVAKVIGPLAGGLASLIGTGGSTADGSEGLFSSVDGDKAISALGKAFGSLNGDEMERIIRRLLIDYHNVSVSGPFTEDKAKPLDLDTFNEVFCCEAQNIFVLCWDVINLNFKGFFTNLKLRFGDLSENMEKVTSSIMESST